MDIEAETKKAHKWLRAYKKVSRYVFIPNCERILLSKVFEKKMQDMGDYFVGVFDHTISYDDFKAEIEYALAEFEKNDAYIDKIEAEFGISIEPFTSMSDGVRFKDTLDGGNVSQKEFKALQIKHPYTYIGKTEQARKGDRT